MKKLILIGAGGYAKSVIDSLDLDKFSIIGFLDEFSQKKEHLGYPILGKQIDDLPCVDGVSFFISIGNNFHRKKWFCQLKKHNLDLINVIDPTAILSPHSTIGSGCFMGKFSIVNSGATIGDNCIINTKALVEHGCVVSSHVNLSTNSVINGDVKVGEGTFVGSGSITIGQISIGEWSTIGAGAVVIRDVEDKSCFAGVPAKLISKRTMLG